MAKQTAIVAAMCFVTFGLTAEYILPDRFSFDSSAMVDIAENLIVGADPSFNIIASLINIFTLPGLTLMIEAAAAGAIFYLLSSRRSLGTLAIAFFTIAVTAPLSLVRPQKENLVFLLAAACVWIISHSKKQSTAILLCVVCYVVYSLISQRPYYWLIIGCIAALSGFSLLSRRNKLLALVLIFVGGFFVPAEIFDLLRLTRDAVNQLRILYPEIEGNRSAFSNPVEAASWMGFLSNYAYAIIRLNFPILFSRTPSEAVLAVYSATWLFVMVKVSASQDWRAMLASRLMLSHLLVLWIFEPDLGSYLRHFSSCFLYLGPMLSSIDRRAVGRYSQWPPMELTSK
jgi:hypothetical protein